MNTQTMSLEQRIARVNRNAKRNHNRISRRGKIEQRKIIGEIVSRLFG